MTLGAAIGSDPAAAEPGTEQARGPAIRPPALKPGDRVRIVAPAYPGDGRLVRGQQILESFGLIVEYGAHVYDQFGYLAGTDADRLADLNAAFRDPAVRCEALYRNRKRTRSGQLRRQAELSLDSHARARRASRTRRRWRPRGRVASRRGTARARATRRGD